MRWTHWFIIALASFFLWGCAGTNWFVSKAVGEYKKIGWETTYQNYGQKQAVSISVGYTDKGQKKLAIDCHQIGSRESYRLHVIFYQERAGDISLFLYHNHIAQGSNFDERCKKWQKCFIKKLPQDKMFAKLPTEIQTMVLKAIKKANKKFQINNYYNR